jgi:superfamily II RNA helicase
MSVIDLSTLTFDEISASGAAPKYVATFFSSLKPAYDDLLTNLNKRDTLVVDADSLIGLALGSTRYSDAYGGQVLHALYLIENFLAKLDARSVTVVVVFFERYAAPLWAPHSSALVIRNALQALLPKSERVRTAYFADAATDVAFHEFLAEEAPAFVCAYDGSASFGDRIGEDNAETAPVRALFDCHALTLLSLRQHVIFMADLTWVDKNAQGFIMRANYSSVAQYRRLLRRATSGWMDELIAASTKEAEALVAAAVPTASAKAVAELGASAAHVEEASGPSGFAAAVAAVTALLKGKGCFSSAPKNGSESSALAQVWLLAVVVARKAPLQWRSQAVADAVDFPSAVRDFVAAVTLAAAANGIPALTDETREVIADPYDGHLFYVVLSLVAQGTVELGATVQAEAAKLWQEAGLAAKLDSASLPKEVPQLPEPEGAPKQRVLLPVENPLIKETLDELQQALPHGEVAIAKKLHAARQAFHQDKGWLESDSLIPDSVFLVHEKKEEADREWELKNPKRVGRARQKYLRFQQNYAESLSGTTAISRRITQAAASGALAAASLAAAEAAKGKQAPTNKVLSKKELMILENERQARIKREREELARWDNINRALPREYRAALRELATFDKSSDCQRARFAALSRRLDLSVAEWKRKSIAGMALPVDIVDTVRQIGDLIFAMARASRIEGGEEAFLDAAKSCVYGLSALRMLGFKDILEVLEACSRALLVIRQKALDTASDDAGSSKGGKDKKGGSKPIRPQDLDDALVEKFMKQLKAQMKTMMGEKNMGDAGLRVPYSFLEFQLLFMGHLLRTGSKRNKPDPRVAFPPDQWQRDLLDIIDTRESAVICAPTSSGKSFISFYAMKTVFLDQDFRDGVVAYVCPTKALVNQVMAQIYFSFGELFSAFVDTYRTNYEKGRFMVTTPECLEILLTDPASASWRKRLRYCILDECHYMGDAGTGRVWERCFSLLRCPFLALSATIGNPGELRDWLQDVNTYKAMQDRNDPSIKPEDISSDKVHLIPRSGNDATAKDRIYRPVDLEQWIALPSPPSARKYQFRGFSKNSTETGIDDTELAWRSEQLVSLNPVASVPAASLQQSFPTQLDLIPRNALAVYRALVDACKENKKMMAAIEDLEPAEYFGSDFVTRMQVREYERELKELLNAWTERGGSARKAVLKVHKAFSAPVREAVQEHERRWATAEYDTDSREYLEETLFETLITLDARDELPALVFHFSERGCNAIAESVIKVLEDMEEGSSSTDDKADKRREAARKMIRKQLEREARQKKSADDGPPDTEMEAEAMGDIFLSEVDPRFSFARPQDSTLAPTEVKRIIDDAVSKNKLFSSDSLLIRGLWRGIGVHHMGLDKKYRDAVELLFRAKYIRVVIATNTLSVGIHMPARTAVFAGDSSFLDALQYRQMAGRAGRRGYDLIGHTVFIGIGEQKVHRLITAEIPRLRGNFSLNPTFVLSQMMLLAQSEDSLTRKSLAPMLVQPFFGYGNKQLSQQVAEYFYFAVQHMRREGLLDEEGKPLTATGIYAHLHAEEPANYAFAALLYSGVLHEVSEPTRSRSVVEVEEELLNLLCHLFQRRPLHRSHCSAQNMARTKSKVVLSPPNDAAQAAIRRADKSAFNSYVDFMHIVAARQFPPVQAVLPLTNVTYTTSEEGAPKDGVLGALAERASPITLCSPFAATSRGGDTFTSPVDLRQSVRGDVHVDTPLMIPTHTILSHDGSEVPLDAYVVDFVHNVNPRNMMDANSIGEHESVWRTLGEFLHKLRMLDGMLGRIAPQNDPFAKSLRRVITALKTATDQIWE